VISHRDEFDAGPDVVIRDVTAGEPEAASGACQSGVRWTGNDPSAVHFPGRPCMGSGCHSATSRTPMTIGGTLYSEKGLNDDDNCNGLNSMMVPAGVAILDGPMGGEVAAIGRLQTNSAGNFWANKALPQSFHVKVVAQSRDAFKKMPVTDGNCNSCHTKDGVAGAKGRIFPEPP
jgi:mono/diheme cytochrome c family protein